MIEFRKVITHGDSLCTCGKKLGSYWQQHTEYRVKRGKRWGPWTTLDEANLPRIEINKPKK